jgi:citrate lyase subunit beta / citryl-CoA lyase
MVAKAQRLPADEVIIDLEDSVAPEGKEEARATAVAAVREGDWEGRSVAVRMNPLAGAWGADDVVALVEGAGPSLSCLVVPKVESAAELELVDGLVSEREAGSGRERALGLQALVETAAGLVHVGEIVGASARLESLIVGYADLAASLGRSTSTDYPGDRWHFVRETVLVAARAAGLQAVDGPHLDIRDLEGLAVEAERARALGFDGKWALHPSQIDPVNRAFTPSGEELKRATSILEALAAAEAGRGALMLDGEMIDEASAKLAHVIVARAHAAGLLQEQGGG